MISFSNPRNVNKYVGRGSDYIMVIGCGRYKKISDVLNTVKLPCNDKIYVSIVNGCGWSYQWNDEDVVTITIALVLLRWLKKADSFFII